MKFLPILLLVLVAVQQICQTDSFVIEVDKERLRKFLQQMKRDFAFLQHLKRNLSMILPSFSDERWLECFQCHKKF